MLAIRQTVFVYKQNCNNVTCSAFKKQWPAPFILLLASTINNISYPVKKTTEGGEMDYSMVRSAFPINVIPLRKKNSITRTEPSKT